MSKPYTQAITISSDCFSSPWRESLALGRSRLSCVRGGIVDLRYLTVGLWGIPPTYRAWALTYTIQRLGPYCHRDLIHKALGRSQPWELLNTIASALLVAYLLLGFLVLRQLHQVCLNVMITQTCRRNWMIVKHIFSIASCK